MSEVQVHDKTFNPPGAGRPPVADISKLIYAAADHPGKWVSQVMTNKEANSAMGQLKRKGYQCSSSQVDMDHREVFVLYGRER